MKNNEVKKNAIIAATIYNGSYQKAYTRRLIKCFVMNPSADVHFGIQEQSKRSFRYIVKDNDKSVRRLPRLFMDRQRVTRWKRSFKRVNSSYSCVADNYMPFFTLSRLLPTYNPVYNRTLWFTYARRRQRKNALMEALDNKPFKWGVSYWDTTIPTNNYNSLYDFLCRGPLHVSRFLRFFDFASPTFNLPWHFNDKDFLDYTRTWGNPYRKPASLCRLHSGQFGFSGIKKLA